MEAAKDVAIGPPASGGALRRGLLSAPGLPVDARGYVHPRTERELCDLVRWARAHAIPMRVRGSAHSVPGAIHSDARLGGGANAGIEVMLDRYTRVSFDDARRRVTVQGGCRLGRDPRDPTGRSRVENGLCWQLEQRGWALPNLPGVSHVTIAGMLATGAAGGSVQHGLHDYLVSMRIVDGTGAVRELSAETDREAFHAGGVSMGLFGIVSSVTLQCVERFDVIGSESVVSADGGELDLCGSGPGSLAAFLRDTPYARVLWWPQRGVDRLVVWQARRMRPDDYDAETGPACALEPRPYRAFEPTFGSTLPLQAAAGAALTVLGGWRGALEHAAGRVVGKTLGDLAARAGLGRAESAIIDAFVPEEHGPPRRFWDAWWRALPMDDEIDERLIPTTFTEIWVPLSAMAEAMRRLRELYRIDARAAGSFVLEIYAAAPSPFWMSPSHGEEAVRFNVFWLENNPGDPRKEYFPKFWRALADLKPRLHWAKLLPGDARATAHWLSGSYPRWNDFLRRRTEFDPDGLFLTAYWRAFLGLADPMAPPAPAPLPQGRPFDAANSAPAFAVEPADATSAHRGSHTIDIEQHVPAPRAAVQRLVEHLDEHASWLSGHTRTEWITEPGVPEEAVVDISFGALTLRLRVLERAAPRIWVATAVGCSAPLWEMLAVCLSFEDAPDGGTQVRARVAYELRRGSRPLASVVEGVLRRAMEESLCRMAAHLGRSPRTAEPAVVAAAARVGLP